MIETIINSANKGLVTDVSPEQERNTSLIDARNVDLITTSDENLVLQKREGSSVYIIDGIEVKLKDGYIPLEVKKYNNVLYIISIDKSNKVELGTFPSPDWDNILPKDGNTQIGTGTPKYAGYYSSVESAKYSFSVTPSSLSPYGYAARELYYTMFSITNTGQTASSYTISNTGEVRWNLLNTSKDIVTGNIVTPQIIPGDTYNFYMLPDVRFNSTTSFGISTISITDGTTNIDVLIQSTSIDGDNISLETHSVTNMEVVNRDAITGKSTTIHFDAQINLSPSEFTFSYNTPTTLAIFATAINKNIGLSQISPYKKEYIITNAYDSVNGRYGIGFFYNYSTKCKINLYDAILDAIGQDIVIVQIKTHSGNPVGSIQCNNIEYTIDKDGLHYRITNIGSITNIS